MNQQSPPTEPLRPPAVAGTWYPADRETLQREVDRYLEAVDARAKGDVTALIAPHAGLVYSGPVGAFAYRAVQGHAYDSIVLVGPSHYVGFDGVAIYARGAFETPCGPMRIDTTLADRCLRASPVCLDDRRAHAREHSLEMQLPFLARVLPDTPIVPMVMGFQTRDTILALADVLAESLTGTRALLVASTDLSHYFDAARAASLDARVVDHVNRFDWAGLLDELEQYPEADRGRYVACGGGPAVAVMRAAHALGATQSVVLKRADSSDVSGEKTQVVGYMAAVMS